MKKFVITALIAGCMVVLKSQSYVKVDLAKNSWLAVSGSTNIVPFKFVQYGDQILPGKSIVLEATMDQNRILLAQNQLLIQVSNFSSDNLMALRDFKKLVKSDTYPAIKVQLGYIDLHSQSSDKRDYSVGLASVNVTIAGVACHYSIPVETNMSGEQVVVCGDKKMSIRDFGLEPPVKLMGLLKVSEWIRINFKILCHFTVLPEVVDRTRLP